MRTLGKMGLTAAFVLATGSAIVTLTNRAPSQSAPSPRFDTTVIDELSRAFENVSEVIRPSVVSIQATQRTELRTNGIAELFGDRFGLPFEQPQGREFLQQGLGSGFILDKDGHIVTNHHVVGRADTVTVVLADNRSFPARVIGSDPKTDVAVIQIDAKDLQPARLGSSKDLRVGQWVVAAGNPFGLSSSITTGIVSAIGRSGVGISDYEDFIQTDAAINPGNSGGPLVNMHGEVVGINSAIYSRTGGSMGIGFAIPADLAQGVIRSLVDEGRVVRGWLGVYIQDLDAAMAESFDYNGTDGALVTDVQPGSPAADARLQAGDIISRLDGKEVHNVNELRLAVAAIAPGTEVSLEVYRDGAFEMVRLRIGELEGASAPTRLTERRDEDFGMSLRSLDRNIARQLNMDPGQRGVVVTQVAPLSPADRAGLSPRDIIVAVQGQPVDDVDAFHAAMRGHKDRTAVRLEVLQGETRRFVLLRRAP